MKLRVRRVRVRGFLLLLGAALLVAGAGQLATQARGGASTVGILSGVAALLVGAGNIGYALLRGRD